MKIPPPKPKRNPFGGSTRPGHWFWTNGNSFQTVQRTTPKQANAAGKGYALNPNPKDAQILLECFHHVLVGFSLLIVNGQILDTNPRSPYMRMLRLYGGEAAAKKLKNAFQCGWEATDIQNELVVIFLTFAKNFKVKPGSNFLGYFTKWFPYHVKNFVFKHQSDVMNYQSLNGLDDYEATDTQDDLPPDYMVE